MAGSARHATGVHTVWGSRPLYDTNFRMSWLELSMSDDADEVAEQLSVEQLRFFMHLANIPEEHRAWTMPQSITLFQNAIYGYAAPDYDQRTCTMLMDQLEAKRVIRIHDGHVQLIFV